MSGKLQTVRATIEADGTVRTLEPVKFGVAVDAVLTFLVEDGSIPNAETIAAMEEAEVGLERFENVDSLFAELNA